MAGVLHVLVACIFAHRDEQRVVCPDWTCAPVTRVGDVRDADIGNEFGDNPAHPARAVANGDVDFVGGQLANRQLRCRGTNSEIDRDLRAGEDGIGALPFPGCQHGVQNGTRSSGKEVGNFEVSPSSLQLDLG